MPFHQILRYERELRGWSQAYLAEKVGVDTKTVRRWEGNKGLPHPYTRQALSRVLGKSIQELGLVDDKEASMSAPHPQADTHSDDEEGKTTVLQKTEQSRPGSLYADTNLHQVTSLEEWGEAPVVASVYGRTQERSLLTQWLQDDSCHVISIVGMGGIGKTTLAAHVATHTKESYSYLFWHSLHNEPSLTHILTNCIRFLSHQQQSTLPDTENELIALLLHYLREHRCLLVLDNFESILQPQQRAGLYKKGYEGYGQLIHRLAEAHHRSCLLLTSRDKPREIVQLEGSVSPVRSLSLQGMDVEAGQAMLQEKALSGSDAEWAELIRLYAGNPLELKLVAEPIQEIFQGSLARFLADGEFAFGDVNDVLEQHVERLTPHEKDILYWLAIEREVVPIETLRRDLLHHVQRSELVEALASLSRRSLLETRKPTSFILQPLIMDYMTARLVKHLVDEFQEEESVAWSQYALLKAAGQDYIRESQARVLLEPLAQRLLDSFGREGLKRHLQKQLVIQRQRHPLQQSYRIGNILNLLIFLGYDLREFDFSHLIIRQVYLQDVPLHNVNFTSAHFVDSVFTNTFGNILSVAFSSDGKLLAAGTATGDIWLYDRVHERQHTLCTGHTDGVWSVAFSPDSLLLASSSDDETIRLWAVHTGECLAVLHEHRERVRAIAFDAKGKILASGSDDGTIRLWNVASRQCVQVLSGHTDRIWAVALHDDILATGSTDHTIRIWDMNTGQCLTVLEGHTNAVRSLAFHPDGTRLASGGDDETIRLWHITNAAQLHVLPGHTNRVWSVAFSSDGAWLASGSEDKTIRIWDVQTQLCVQILSSHTQGVRSLAFHRNLLMSGGDDQTARLWDITTGHCLRTFHGYTHRIWSVLFHPDGQYLLSCSEDQSLRLWDIQTKTCIRTIEERPHGVLCMACSPDGMSCASGGEDETVRLWNLTSGRSHKTLRGHTNWIRAVAFHPGGHLLASGSEDTTVRLWDVDSGLCLHTLMGHSSWIRAVVFNKDGSILASCGDDAAIRLWNPATGSLIKTLTGHQGRIRSLAFHPESQVLVSGGEDATIRLWNGVTGQNTMTLKGHQGRIRCVTFSPNGQTFASSGEDDAIRLWNTADGQCWLTLHIHTKARWLAFHPGGHLLANSGDDGTIQLWHLPTGRPLQPLVSEKPYEGMNITHAQGLTPAQKETLRLLGAIEVV